MNKYIAYLNLIYNMAHVGIGKNTYDLSKDSIKLARGEKDYKIIVNGRKTRMENILIAPLKNNLYPYIFEEIDKHRVLLTVNHTDNPVMLNGNRVPEGDKKLITKDSKIIIGDCEIKVILAN